MDDSFKKTFLICLYLLFLGIGSIDAQNTNDKSRENNLELILKWLSPDATQTSHVSYRDATFKDWLNRTGELPPDFDKMPSIPYLPNPLIIDEGGENIPVKIDRQWKEKKEWMKKELQHWITGTFPPPPDNLQIKIISEKKEDKVTIRNIELSFGPERKAKMTLELMIPLGKGAFPVFLTQWNHRDWAALAVKRGYIGCVYAGADMKDDAKDYAELWEGEYDFSLIMARAYGASRVVDYLFTLPEVDKNKIGITGHSRNGKQSLWAAAFDERIGAVITSSGGSGGEVPWRYSRHKYGCEDIGLLSTAQPAWLHPRLRFFIGRENKLPVDQNSFMALVAPRGLMLSSSRRESDSNPWGIEQVYDSVLKVYDFTGNPDHFAVRLRDGRHGTSSRDIEDYIDFFDYVFGRNDKRPQNELFYKYSFDKWQELSGEDSEVALLGTPKPFKSMHSDKKGDKTLQQWYKDKRSIQEKIRWLLGDEPKGIVNLGPKDYQHSENLGEDYFGNMIPRPEKTKDMGRVTIAPGHSKPGFGDGLYGYLYYPKDQEMLMKSGLTELPVIIFAHKFDYSNGMYDTQGFDHSKLPFLKSLVRQGYAVFLYDMMGFANRIEEGTDFYQRYPHWSKMGKHVTDLRSAVTALYHLNFIDSTQISVLGYSLGATVGLFAAAIDHRIASVTSISGFTPMRTNTPDKGTEGIKTYSHLQGLMPRLGFFVGKEEKIPVDFDAIIGSIAPRPVLIIAPKYDQDATLSDIIRSVDKSKNIYRLLNFDENIRLEVPNDYSRFSPSTQDSVLNWYRLLLDNKSDTHERNEDLLKEKMSNHWTMDRTGVTSKDVWQIKDDRLFIKDKNKRGSLMTKETYGDFELTFEFNLTDMANSGIKYLVNKVKNNKTGKEEWIGPEYQIIDDYKHPAIDGDLASNTSTASFYLIASPMDKELFPAGQWNKGKIVVAANHVEHWLNGKKVVDISRGNRDFKKLVEKTKFVNYTDFGEALEGYIQIQNHGGDRVYFRNVRIKRL